MPKRKMRRMQEKSSKMRRTRIGQHKRSGDRLIPPFLTLPGAQGMSWRDNRLPDILWAALLVCNLPRESALATFRELAEYIHTSGGEEDSADVTHKGLARMGSQRLSGALSVIARTEEQRRVLSPLRLFEALPAGEAWRSILPEEKPDVQLEYLMSAVSKTLFHQTQEATDCRWVKVLCMMAAGKLKFPRDLEQKVVEILEYPHRGDMRSVRPMIRAAEMAFPAMDENEHESKREWPRAFWQACFERTSCIPLGIQEQCESKPVPMSPEQIATAYRDLALRAMRTQTSSNPDPRHELIFGIGLYCLRILGELACGVNNKLIVGRIGLRAMVECYITLAYLVKMDKPELWASYKAFGVGRAKLASLKFAESVSEPAFITSEALDSMVNEDVSEDFVAIDLGHWDKSNLRKISELGGTKDIYDRFYDWSSTYVHGHWGALRTTVFGVCGNPLHRYHRIPGVSAGVCPDVLSDGCDLANKTLQLIDACYPAERCAHVVISAAESEVPRTSRYNRKLWME